MRFNVPFKWSEGYLPTKRHRVLRYREAEAVVEVEIPEVTRGDAPVAFRIHSPLGGHPSELRWWGKRLWKRALKNHAHAPEWETVEDLPARISYNDHYGSKKDKDAIAGHFVEKAASFLIIDGEVYESQGEPRYCLYTFGLGHNHGGSALSVDYRYNPNISKHRYFNALDKDKAISEAKRIALARGDDQSVDSMGDEWIEVLIPEAVRCNPMAEHGDGDPFINKIEALTEGSPDVMIAGFMAMAALANELNKKG